ncbi:MAG TPA: hypothetical protein VGP92_16795 [Acidimicrobiia bacterium]|jgi:hypothetical protein|nr:hypothetical protein [Acidimicrobiia bacterium]
MRFTKTIATASVAAVLGLAGVSVAGATSTSTSTSGSAAPTTSATNGAATPKAGAQNAAQRRARRLKIRRGAAAVITKTIHITRVQLRTELRAGKTIAAIATEHGVQPQAVIDALESAATTRIDAALAAHKITPERAARLKQRVATAVPKIVNSWHPRHAATS